MELFILIITLAILAETTLLVVRGGKAFRSNGANQRRKVYVDTSALMDPRLLELAKTGFMSDNLLISHNVVHELQMLADGKDSEKRLRARSGLDAINELERVVFINVELMDDEVIRTPVDDILLGYAKSNHGTLLTNDYNLKKVATAEHVDTLSINELALVLRNEYLPGERTTVKIITEGSNPHQGVAYLRDGTMVVVDNASTEIGKEIEVEFMRLNQSAAGSMMFARIVNRNSTPSDKNPTNKPATQSNKTIPMSKISAPNKSLSKDSSKASSKTVSSTAKTNSATSKSPKPSRSTSPKSTTSASATKRTTKHTARN